MSHECSLSICLCIHNIDVYMYGKRARERWLNYRPKEIIMIDNWQLGIGFGFCCDWDCGWGGVWSRQGGGALTCTTINQQIYLISWTPRTVVSFYGSCIENWVWRLIGISMTCGLHHSEPTSHWTIINWPSLWFSFHGWATCVCLPFVALRSLCPGQRLRGLGSGDSGPFPNLFSIWY